MATDVAARGIDVKGITHVIHMNMPDEMEYYTHRSGRTARAGKKGISLAIVAKRSRENSTS
ncbi:MAG: helicase-related protein [Cytophagales bacterium]|nr:helicase-related protein [Cytophagales bacterium]